MGWHDVTMMDVATVPVDGWGTLGRWALEPATVAILLGVGSAYLAGCVRARRLGRSFPARRPIAFATGWVALVLALVSPVDVYADVSFTVHMLQHLLLTFVAPPLLALGAPITLALATLPTRGARSLAGVLRSRGARVLGNPVVGWALFVGVPIAVHGSRLFDVALTSSGWHALEHAAWVGAALVYWWPIVGVDPSPHPVGLRGAPAVAAAGDARDVVPRPGDLHGRRAPVSRRTRRSRRRGVRRRSPTSGTRPC